MSDFFWSTQNPSGQDVRCEGGEIVHVDPKNMGAIAGDAGNFVWADPTAVQAGNVYNNWPDLAKAILGVRGQKTVTCVAAALTMTAGAWADITDVTFVAGENVPVNVVVTVADGATLTSIHRITLDSVIFEYAGTTGPCITLTGSQELIFDLKDAGAVGTTGGHPMVQVGDTATLLSFADRGSAWGANTVAIAAIGATATFLLFNASALQSGAVTATALGTVNITLDGASQSLLSATAVGTIAPNVQVTDPQPTFVFRPGATGTLDGNVFTTWAALMEAVKLCDPQDMKFITVDDNLAPAHATIGAWDVNNCVIGGNFGSAGNEELICDVGCVFTASWVKFWQGLTVHGNSNAPVLTMGTGGAFAEVDVDNATLESTTTTAFLSVAGGGGTVQVLMSNNAALGDGTHPAITVGAGFSLRIQASDNGNIHNAALAGLGSVDIFAGPQMVIGTHTITTQTLHFGIASQITYTPGTAGNWNPAPTLVSAALDQLAAPNFTQASGNTGTGTGTVTVTTGNITKAKNGQMNVAANISGVTTSATTVTLQLKRDATSIGNPIVVTTLSAGDGFTGSISFIDTAPDNAAHTYQLSAVAGAGNLTVQTNSAQINVSEGS